MDLEAGIGACPTILYARGQPHDAISSQAMVREQLKLKLPAVKLQGLWKALDENESGYICAGEFGT